MDAGSPLTEIAHAIQLAVTPVFLLAGVGITVNTLTTRLGRIIDRTRVVSGSAPAGVAPADPAPAAELAVLARRAHLIYRAIALSLLCALCVCLTVTTLFVGAFVGLNLARGIPLLFVTAMLAFIGALLTFFQEIMLATHPLRLGTPAPLTGHRRGTGRPV